MQLCLHAFMEDALKKATPARGHWIRIFEEQVEGDSMDKKSNLDLAINNTQSMSGLGITYGYARVSTKEQNIARQIKALQTWGVSRSNIFEDKASGKSFTRPSYQRLIQILKPGDTLVVKSIDRLGRHYEEIVSEWRKITHEKGAAIAVIDMPLLDTREGVSAQAGLTGRLISDIVLQVLSYVANIERDNIRQRQAEGIALAKERGVRFGRPEIKKPRTFESTKKAYELGQLTRKEAATRLKVSPNTFDKWVKTVS